MIMYLNSIVQMKKSIRNLLGKCAINYAVHSFTLAMQKEFQ